MRQSEGLETVRNRILTVYFSKSYVKEAFKLSHFHLSHRRHSSLLFGAPHCQQHCSCALEPLLSKLEPLNHKHCGTVTVDLISQTATR